MKRKTDLKHHPVSKTDAFRIVSILMEKKKLFTSGNCLFYFHREFDDCIRSF